MSDTVLPALAAASISSSVGVVIFGVDTGLDYPTLIAGILGGATALSYLQPGKPLKRFGEVISASMLAGYASPMLSSITIHKMIKWEWIPADANTPPSLQLALAFLIAFLAHGVLLPGIKKFALSMFREGAK